MLVVLAVFSSVILVAVDVYFTGIRVQRFVGAAADTQNDARFALETMIRSVRTGRIDYAYYRKPLFDGDGSSNEISLAVPVPILAVRDQNNNQVFYRKDGDNLSFCTNTTDALEHCDTLGNWQPVNPADVTVTNVKFIITPGSDPAWVPTSQTDCLIPSGTNYVAIGSCTCVPILNGADCLTDQTCEATTDSSVPNICVPKNSQPLVTILFEAKGEKETATDTPLRLQTTVAQRELLR